MKTKTPPRFSHRFAGNVAHVAWEGAPPLAVPLAPALDGDELPARRWKVKQGSAQARLQHGGGFLAFDYRADGYFHWRGHLGEVTASRLAVVRDWDVRGWTLVWPGEEAPIPIGDRTERRLVASLAALDGAAAPRARWFYFRPTAGDGPGWVLSFAGPVAASGVELGISGGFLDVSLLDFDNLAEKGRFAGPYLVPAVASLDEGARFHALLTGKEGYVRHNDRPRPWWSAPTVYATNAWLASLAGVSPEAATTRALALLDRVAAAAPGNGAARGALLALDTHWCDAVGDWNPSCPPLFEGFADWRVFRDRLAAAGHHVLLAFPPFLLDPESARFAESSWHALGDAEGFPLRAPGGEVFLDYTSPETRQLLDDLLAHLLGRGDDQLGADGLVLEPLFSPPNREAAWSDPTWSTGEYYWTRVLLHLAAAARRVRPDALLEVAGNDAVLSRTGQRARAAALFGGAPDGAAVPPRDAPRPASAEMVPGTIAVRLVGGIEALAAAPAPAGLVLGGGDAA